MRRSLLHTHEMAKKAVVKPRNQTHGTRPRPVRLVWQTYLRSRSR